MNNHLVRCLPVLAVVSAGLSGCSYEQQVRNVARDWCMTIRASQVIPVYPLTEDLQPGDIFLVTSSGRYPSVS
jgi:hypothetical protein